MKTEGFPERSVLLAPFGRHTRYVLQGYVRHTLICSAALLSVALAIDIVRQIDIVVGDLTGWAATTRLVWFIILRGADLLPRFIPLLAFIGVLWTEIAQTISRERILIWNTGRSPAHCLIPVLVFAILLGAIQFTFDVYLRPAAMHVQIQQHLGLYGEEFDRSPSKDSLWLSSGDDLIHARITYGPPPALRDIRLYRLNENSRLLEVDNAQGAVPGPVKGNWILQQGSTWTIPAEDTDGPAPVTLLSPGTKATATNFDQRAISLALDPLWLTVYGIYPEYLSMPVLRELAGGATDGDPRVLYVTRLHVNHANALMPGAMALLAATLCLLLLSYSAPIIVQLALLPFGYGGHLAMKTFILMGEHDYISPVAAAWTAPLALLALSGVLLAISEMRRRDAFSKTRAQLQQPG